MFWLVVIAFVVIPIALALVYGKPCCCARKPQNIEEVIDAHAEALGKAQEALGKSQAHLHSLEARVRESTADINVLKARAQKAVDEGKDDEARSIIKRMKSEEQALSEHQKNLDDARRDHQWYADSVEKEHKAIMDARQNAEALNTKLELAQATKAYQQSTDGLDSARVGLEAKVRIAEAQVKATDTAKSDEFLDAADASDVEATLAQMKKKE